MNKKSLLILIILFLFSLNGCFPKVFSGIVVDKDNNNPVEGATVLLDTYTSILPDKSTYSYYATTTNKDGKFTIIYQRTRLGITIFKKGYYTNSYQTQINNNTTYTIEPSPSDEETFASVQNYDFYRYCNNIDNTLPLCNFINNEKLCKQLFADGRITESYYDTCIQQIAIMNKNPELCESIPKYNLQPKDYQKTIRICKKMAMGEKLTLKDFTN